MLHTVDDGATRSKRQPTDNPMTRVAGTFTVEGVSPHRTLAVDWDDELIATYEVAESKQAQGRRSSRGFQRFRPNDP